MEADDSLRRPLKGGSRKTRRENSILGKFCENYKVQICSRSWMFTKLSVQVNSAWLPDEADDVLMLDHHGRETESIISVLAPAGWMRGSWHGLQKQIKICLKKDLAPFFFLWLNSYWELWHKKTHNSSLEFLDFLKFVRTVYRIIQAMFQLSKDYFSCLKER